VSGHTPLPPFLEIVTPPQIAGFFVLHEVTGVGEAPPVRRFADGVPPIIRLQPFPCIGFLIAGLSLRPLSAFFSRRFYLLYNFNPTIGFLHPHFSPLSLLFYLVTIFCFF